MRTALGVQFGRTEVRVYECLWVFSSGKPSCVLGRRVFGLDEPKCVRGKTVIPRMKVSNVILWDDSWA